MSSFAEDRCALCGAFFTTVLTDEQKEHFEIEKERYPHMEPIMLCVDCCNRIEARMPHKAYLN